MIYEKLYKYLPISFQNIAVSCYGYYWKNRRYGGGFKKEVLKFKKREKFSKNQWIEYQTKQLRKLLLHAYDTVPFYTELYKKHGYERRDFLNFNLSSLKNLPYLEKEDLRKFGSTTLLSTKKRKGKFYSSSGSTGKPTKIYFSKEVHRMWLAAYEARVRNWAGVNYKNSRGMIGGKRVLSTSKNTPPFYRYNSAEKQTYFSAYHISQKNVENYIKGMLDNKIEYMVGYAMSNYLLADFIEREQLKAPKIKAMITSSEKLTQEMRNTFQRVYSCKTFDSYSGVEACGLISENKEGDFLFNPDTGLLEVVDEEGNEVSNGEEGEIISTGFLNFDQPLIRYRIGDRAKKSLSQESKSGIEMPLIDEIIGRVEDVVITSEGKKMVRFHGVFININGLKLSQVVQERLNSFTLNLVVDMSSYNLKSEKIMINRLKSQVGNEIVVKFNYLKKIPNIFNGKYKSVISKI